MLFFCSRQQGNTFGKKIQQNTECTAWNCDPDIHQRCICWLNISAHFNDDLSQGVQSTVLYLLDAVVNSLPFNLTKSGWKLRDKPACGPWDKIRFYPTFCDSLLYKMACSSHALNAKCYKDPENLLLWAPPTHSVLQFLLFYTTSVQ